MLAKQTIRLIRALDTRKGRRREGLFVAEGPKLVGELLGHFQCVRILATDYWQPPCANLPLEHVTDDELARASLLQTPQQVLAIMRIPDYNVDPVAAMGRGLCLALDGVQDPGNLGTIVRVADWFGIEDIWCSQQTADVWNPKAVQASMGGLSRVRVHYIKLYNTLAALPANVPIYGTSLTGESFWQTELTSHGVIVMGNEGNGVTPEVDSLCSRRLLIPSYPSERPTTESLNVGMATGIVLAEFRRRVMGVGQKLFSFFMVALVAAATILSGCSPTRFLEEDEWLLSDISIKADSSAISTSPLQGYIRQHPNAKWFSLAKVPMGVYCLSGRDGTKPFNRFIRRIGEAPVVYDSVQAERTRSDIEAAVQNLGYLNARVEVDEQRHHRRVSLKYRIHPEQRFTVANLSHSIDDPALDSLYEYEMANSSLYEGMPFDINLLDKECTRISAHFQNNGYFRFNKSFIRFDADTVKGNHTVDLRMHIPLYQATANDSLRPHQCYTLGRVNFLSDVDMVDVDLFRNYYEGADLNPEITELDLYPFKFYQLGRLHLLPSFLVRKSEIMPGRIYREADVQQTYNNLSSLSSVLAANVSLEPSPEAPDTLDAYISLLMAKRHSLSAELEGTNSAGDFGAALVLGYQNRNLFRRSAMLSVELRGAFEAIKGLEGYADQNYIEYSAEATLNFPEFKFPLLSRRFRRYVRAQSMATLMYDSQDRPEFHRRVLTAGWRYRWNRYDKNHVHRFDLIDLDYVFMPWISETFKTEYLSDNGSRNAILRYNYENLFIMRWGYSYQFTSVPAGSQGGVYGRNAWTMRLGIETAGNLLYGLSHLLDGQHSDSKDAYTLFNIAYAEYVKFDFDFAKSFRVDDRNSFAMHVGFGIAFPYGNSTVLPYEKRYFSGGANSVRGWSIRGLGPGSFAGSDGRVDFIRQTGDMKMDASVEWRSHLFWKIDGAFFVDAGNVWTLRDYPEQPGGQFRFDKFWRQIAVAYGLGLRLNFGYFILRLDGGMKAVNPAYESGRLRYPLINPRFGRDFQLHFAVGLPF